MFGLRKPSTQRSRRTRNPAINPNPGRGGSLFISSYHDDKLRKHHQQTKETVKRLLKWATLAGIIFAVVKSQSLAQTDETATVLRGGINANDKMSEKTTEAAAAGDTKTTKVAVDSHPPKPEVKVPYCSLVDNSDASDAKGSDKPENVEKGSDDSICGRKIPINLAEESKKPIPPLGPDAIPGNKKEVVLIKKASSFGGTGNQLNSFFRAYDYAYETKNPLYITQDSTALDTLFPLFFGPLSAVEKNALLWKTIEEALGVKIIENEGVLDSMKMTKVGKSHQGFFYYHAKGLESAKIRDHRSAILRRLFHYPSHKGRTNVCSTIDALLGKERDKKYTVIHISDPSQNNWLGQFNGNTGKDHTAAAEQKPDYVKNILKRLDMLKHDIYPVDTGGTANDVVHTLLAKDPDLTNQLKCAKGEKPKNHGGNIYLAVLADVYFGNPVNQMSLWIARMRAALGMKNTFVFTEKKGDEWVSYMNEDNYLELYDSKLGLWMA